MGQEYQIIEILFFAIIAAFVVLRLRSVLGRRTGHERPPRDPFAARDSLSTPRTNTNEDQASANSNRESNETEPLESGVEAVAPAGSKLNQTLTEIQIADRSFDVDHFLGGARSAYEMIVTAFAQGDTETLRPLLADDVFQSFQDVIEDRKSRGETVHFEFVGFREARISDATLEGRTAELTVTFESQIIQAVKSADGEVLSGDPDTVVTVVDVWTFSRDLKSKGPEWLLIGTDAGA